jgi:hypothetical protein
VYALVIDYMCSLFSPGNANPMAPDGRKCTGTFWTHNFTHLQVNSVCWHYWTLLNIRTGNTISQPSPSLS